MKQSLENGQKTHFGLKMGPFGPIYGRDIFFEKSDFVTFLDLLKANLMQKIRKK